MHHKRRRAKAARAGCLMCKPHKLTGQEVKKHTHWEDDGAARGKARRVRRPLARDLA